MLRYQEIAGSGRCSWDGTESSSFTRERRIIAVEMSKQIDSTQSAETGDIRAALQSEAADFLQRNQTEWKHLWEALLECIARAAQSATATISSTPTTISEGADRAEKAEVVEVLPRDPLHYEEALRQIRLALSFLESCLGKMQGACARFRDVLVRNPLSINDFLSAESEDECPRTQLRIIQSRLSRSEQQLEAALLLLHAPLTGDTNPVLWNRILLMLDSA